MKLLIMHLSDMHFGDGTNYSKENVNSIVSAMNDSMTEIQRVLIIVSGDLTYSGKQNECKKVVRFFEELKQAINTRYQVQDIRFVMVPGNHDVDYNTGVGDRKREGLEAIDKAVSYDTEISAELEKLQQFYTLSERYRCFGNKNLLHQKTLNYDSVKIQVNLINTAVFSSNDEDQGYHFLRQSDLDRLGEQGDSDFVFSVMHHPQGWFNWRVSDQLEAALYERSDLIFVGHKHYEATRTISDAKSTVDVLAGGMLSDRGNWESSEFHIGVLDTDTRLFETKKYQWNSAGKVYVEKGNRTITLSKNRVNPMGLTVQAQFLDEYIRPDQFLIASSFLDYFVFPLLEEQRDEQRDGVTHDVSSMEDFLERLESSRKVLVSGLNDSGKSALTKAAFVELSAKKTVLLLHGSKVDAKPERTVRNAFEAIYGRDPSIYERFKQADPSSLALIIDDVDAIDDAYRDGFIDYVNDRFGSILETCQQEIELDIQSRFKKKHDRKHYSVFRLEPFYANKRRELVTKIISIIGNDGQNKDEMISLLCDMLSKQKTLYNWSPSFIIQFTKYYYNNIGESSQNDGDVFSKVFENNLVSLIKPFASKGISIDKIFMILDKIAYEIYKLHEYPISTTRVCEIVDAYNERYDSIVNAMNLVAMLVSARVLKAVDNGFLFYELSYLAYFTAREIRRRIPVGDYDDIKNVMQYSYMNIHADILLFVTYITDNLNIIRMLMQMAERTVQNWEEFSLSPVNVEYMKQPAHLIIKPVEEGDREKEEQKHIETEKEETKALTTVNDASIFEGESEELDFIQEMLRSTSLMTTLARALPSFEHMMEKEDKEKCVALLYTMPLRIFCVWAKEVDESRSELVQMIKEFHEWEYRKDKPDIEPLSDHKALMMLRWESTSLLLELMNAAFGYATKENTWRFIDRFDFKIAPTYGIEHLMGIEYRDAVAPFISEALRLFDDKEAQTKLMIQRVSRHYMVTSKRIQFGEIQQLNSKLFSDQLKPAHLLIEQGKNKNKK